MPRKKPAAAPKPTKKPAAAPKPPAPKPAAAPRSMRRDFIPPQRIEHLDDRRAFVRFGIDDPRAVVSAARGPPADPVPALTALVMPALRRLSFQRWLERDEADLFQPPGQQTPVPKVVVGSDPRGVQTAYVPGQVPLPPATPAPTASVPPPPPQVLEGSQPLVPPEWAQNPVQFGTPESHRRLGVQPPAGTHPAEAVGDGGPAAPGAPARPTPIQTSPERWPKPKPMAEMEDEPFIQRWLERDEAETEAAPGGKDPEAAVGGFDPEAAPGGKDPEAAVGGFHPGTASGGVDPEAAVGGFDPEAARSRSPRMPSSLVRPRRGPFVAERLERAWQLDTGGRVTVCMPREAGGFEHAVEFIRSLRGAAFYIGITGCPKTRWNGMDTMPGHCQQWDAMTVLFEGSTVETADLERRLIRHSRSCLRCTNVGDGGERAGYASPHYLYIVTRASGLIRRFRRAR